MRPLHVLVDLHHEALFASLRLLFEKRLGGKVYRPVGLEWFDEGWWSYPFHARDTAQQFLGPAYGSHEGVKLDNFLVDWQSYDLAIASTPEQFYRWQDRFRHHGITLPLVMQMGNRWEVPHGCRFLLNSTTVPAPPGCHAVYYHQEFPLEDFTPPGNPPRKVISSFMHYMAEQDKRGWFQSLQGELPGWELCEFGAGGALGAVKDVGLATRRSRYVYHPKKVEAYGYVVHQAAASGVPLIMRVAANKGEAIGALLTPETSLDIDEYVSPGHLADAIRRFDEGHEEHSRAIAAAFREHVNFDAEEAKIREWLQTVIAR